jgi:prepilin-type processing-associated H-X9-DG protein
MGTSYESNNLMWKIGWESWKPRFGPKDVFVSASMFVLAGDAGGMRIAEVGHHNDAIIQGWWHGKDRCQMAFLDGHASHRPVIGDQKSNGYSFKRLP